MKKTIYHGSTVIIQKPIFGKGAFTNDYGRGFYCTENLELAKEWACADDVDGYANVYELNMRGLSVLNLNSEDYNILNWLAVLTRFRSYWQKNTISEEAKNYLQEHFYVDVDQFDVIIGYRADDSYFTFAQDFISNAISLRKLSQAMRLGRLGEQIVLKSEKAFRAIHFTESVPADAEEYFSRKKARDSEARRQYRLTKGEKDSISDVFMLDIMRQGIVSGDERIQI